MRLIVGGDSAIGKRLAEYWRERGVSVLSTTRQEEKLSENQPYLCLETGVWDAIFNLEFDFVVICAGITKIAECQENLDRSRLINVTNTIRFVEQIRQKTRRILFLSSNQVFDGSRPYCRPNDSACPTSEYGRQKLEVERYVLNFDESAVLRLTKVVHDDWDLLKRWRQQLINGQFISAFTNVNIAPLPVEKVIKTIDTLAISGANGIHHLSGDADVSYFSYAQTVADRLGCSRCLVQRARSELVDIPRFTTLSA